MADGFRFEPDRAGIERVATGPAVDAVLNERAQAAAGKMRNLAGSLRAGSFFRFRSSIRVIRARGHGDDRAAYVGSDSPGWHLQEFGTARERPRAIIRRAMKSTPGIRFEEGSSR